MCGWILTEGYMIHYLQNPEALRKIIMRIIRIIGNTLHLERNFEPLYPDFQRGRIHLNTAYEKNNNIDYIYGFDTNSAGMWKKR